MPTFTTSIKLYSAGEKDIAYLRTALEEGASMNDQRITPDTSRSNGDESVFVWEGDVSIQKIAGTIFRAAPRTGKKYSFSIMKNK